MLDMSHWLGRIFTDMSRYTMMEVRVRGRGSVVKNIIYGFGSDRIFYGQKET